jgi:pseudaminic acid cytidylyltransferase
MNVAIIPARGGSKRIPRKNIRPFCGRPMIAWSIERARQSGLFDRIIVSTDDPEIMTVARDHGAEVPFVRPTELANDHAATLPVVRHAVEWLIQNGAAVDLACCLYATAPLLKEENLRDGCRALQRDPQLDFAFAVARFDFPIFRAVGLESGNRVKMFWPEHETTRSQDLPSAFHDAGQFYWGTRNAWLKRERIFSACSTGVIVPGAQVQDIDVEEDWILAELKFKALHAAAAVIASTSTPPPPSIETGLRHRSAAYPHAI